MIILPLLFDAGFAAVLWLSGKHAAAPPHMLADQRPPATPSSVRLVAR